MSTFESLSAIGHRQAEHHATIRKMDAEYLHMVEVAQSMGEISENQRKELMRILLKPKSEPQSVPHAA